MKKQEAREQLLNVSVSYARCVRECMNEADTNNIATELFRQEKGKELWTHLQEILRGPCDTKTETTSKMDDKEKDNKNNAKRRAKATMSKITKNNTEIAEMTTVNNA